jgi:hypothetical protein
MLQAGKSPIRVLDEVDFFNLPIPSSRTMALGSTQPLTEMSTRNLPGGKSGRRVGLTTLPPSVSECLKMWEPQPLAILRAPTSRTGITLPLPLHPARISMSLSALCTCCTTVPASVYLFVMA